MRCSRTKAGPWIAATVFVVLVGAARATDLPLQTISGNFRGISSVGDNVWIADDAGALLKSTDNGVNWHLVSIPTTRNLQDVEFWSDSLGIVTTTDTVAFRTADGGKTWDSTRLTGMGGYVQFANGRRVWISKSGRLWRSDDGGSSWALLITAPEDARWFLDSLHGWSIRYGYDAYRTTNGGVSWTLGGRLPGMDPSGGCALAFYTPSRGICAYSVYQHPVTYYFWAVTANGGVNWSELTVASPGISSDVDPAGRIYGLEEQGCLYYTESGFDRVTIGSGYQFRGITAARGRYPWICGLNQALLYSPDSGKSWQSITVGLAEAQTVPAVDWPDVVEARPNPCHDRAAVTLPVPNGVASRAMLVDIGGRVLKYVSIAAEARSVMLDTRDVPAGVYCLREDGHLLARIVRAR